METLFSVKVTEQELNSFAQLSGDWNPLHTDKNYACNTTYGGNILHGAFSSALISRVAGMYLPGKYCLLHRMNLRFLSPITVPATLVVKAKEKSKGWVEVEIINADSGVLHVQASYSYGLHRELIKNNKKHAKEIVKETLLEYHLADYITVPSSFVKRSMNEAGINPEKIFVNPYGVDLSQFKQIPKQDNIFRVIFCGNLSIQKGSHYLLQSIYELNLEDFECWHIGKISSEMEVFIKKYRTKKMKYKGVQPQSELYKLYSQGSVFCMPSLQEGMAMVQLQAMACGLPLICTTNTGGDDLITADGKEGFVIPVKSVDSIKEKINYLYKNRSECREMGLKARQRVSKGFTWNDYGDRYTLFLESVINK